MPYRSEGMRVLFVHWSFQTELHREEGRDVWQQHPRALAGAHACWGGGGMPSSKGCVHSCGHVGCARRPFRSWLERHRQSM